MRLVVCYGRSGAANYVSHLDMQRLFMRAFRRAKIAAQYSKGFNPHILMSFASALSVGYGAASDYFEAAVESGTDANFVKDALNIALPPDVRVNSAFFIADNAPKLAAVSAMCDYELTPRFENQSECDRINKALDCILRGEEYIVTDRKGRTVNVSPLVKEAYIKDGKLFCKLINTNRVSLNPAALLGALNLTADVRRLECYADIDGRIMPYGQMAEVFPYNI